MSVIEDKTKSLEALQQKLMFTNAFKLLITKKIISVNISEDKETVEVTLNHDEIKGILTLHGSMKEMIIEHYNTITDE